MPVTVPAHQVAVLPLKLAWPRRFDGVTLVIGSAAPDLAYAFLPWAPFGASHGVGALAWWSVPVGVVLAVVVRRLVLPGAVYLPAFGFLHLRDYAACARARHRWWITGSSALLGAVTHVGWDYFTHAGGLLALATASPLGPPWYQVLQYGSGGLGTAVTAWCVVRIGRRRLIRRWHGTVEHAGSATCRTC